MFKIKPQTYNIRAFRYVNLHYTPVLHIYNVYIVHTCSNKGIFVLIQVLTWKSWTRFIFCFLQNFFHFPDNIFRQLFELRVIISRPASRNVGFRYLTTPLLILAFWLLAIKPVQQFLKSKICVLTTYQVLSGELKSFCNSIMI